MRITTEIIDDISTYYEKLDSQNKLSLLNFKAEKTIFQADNEYYELCSEAIRRLFNKSFNTYAFFWFTGVEINSLGLRISHYKKVWKSLKSDFDLKEFKLGPEIQIMHQGNYGKEFFVGISKFNIDKFPIDSEMIRGLLKRGILIASSFDLLNENFLREIALFSHGDKKGGYLYYYFDYLNIGKRLCPRGDIVFRYVQDYELEYIRISLLMNNNMIELVKNAL